MLFFDRRLLRNFDYTLLLAVFGIVLISLVNISSATLINDTGNPLYFVQRHLTWIAIGLVVLFFVVLFDYTNYYRFAHAFYAVNILLLLAVLVIGRETGGSQRWIPLGFFDFQPSEVAKVVIIVSLARLLAEKEGGFESFFSIIPAGIYVMIPVFLIFRQPDLGTSLVFVVILIGMLFMAGVQIKHLAACLMAGTIAGIVGGLTMLKDYQRDRLLVFLNPESDPLGTGYQLINSMIAIGSGGLTGKGLYSGTQSQLQFLPAQHTDFIFSVLAEEWGFLGAFVLLLLFLLLIYRVLYAASIAKDAFGHLVCIGVASMFSFQLLVNVGMTIGIMPVTGLPLPFMSYGGSALIVNMVAVGLVLNIGMRRHKLMF